MSNMGYYPRLDKLDNPMGPFAAQPLTARPKYPKASGAFHTAMDTASEMVRGGKKVMTSERAIGNYKRAGIGAAGLAGAAGLYEGGKYAYHKHQEHKSIPSTGESY